MPIKGLTEGASLPVLGVLRKGGVKSSNKPGKDLDYFRFTSNLPGIEKLFYDEFGKEPDTIEFFLPFATVDDNFSAWVEEWQAGGLVWRGDGETLVLWQTPQGTYSTEAKPQPPNSGKPVARMSIVIPELKRLGTVTVQTTSQHDIRELYGNLQAIFSLRGSLQGIPFVLSRVPKEISTPGPDGKRIRRTKSLLHIEAAPQWVALQVVAMQQASLPVLALGAGRDDYDIDDETGEIVDPMAETNAALFGDAEPEPEPSVAWTNEFLDYVVKHVPYYRHKRHVVNTANKLGLQPPTTKAEAAAVLKALQDYAAEKAETTTEQPELVPTENAGTGAGAYEN